MSSNCQICIQSARNEAIIQSSHIGDMLLTCHEKRKHILNEFVFQYMSIIYVDWY
jgi:hypothetical protein